MTSVVDAPGAPIARRERAVLDAVPKSSLIGGRRLGAASGGALGVEDPATGEILCELATLGSEGATEALAAASRAQAEWAATPARTRADLLRSAYDIVTERSEEVALLITLEMGKPLPEARAEVAYGADFLRWYSEEATRIGGRYGDNSAGTGRILVRRHPIGPCVLVTPWNFPLAMATRKIGPALAAGCTAVVKPARQTPLTTLLLASILEEAGLPAGVLNVIITESSGPVVSALIADPRARKLSFTGSTEVGRRLLEQCSKRVLRSSMELGGNAPLIVFDDADLETALAGAMVAKLRNGGQSCTAGNRFYVQEGIADAFVEEFARRMGAVRVGRGTEDVELGPLIDEAGRAKVQELVDDAVAAGAELLTGGSAPAGPGHFYPATVLDRVPSEATILREEIFGPVAPIVRFASEDEVVKAANGTEYGLVSYLFTRDLDRALRVGDRLDSGMVGINQGMVSNAAAPFGGIKESGLGREGGAEGLEDYTTLKYVGIASPPRAPDFGDS
jgi:succinate-semialdehyde dehydrogenase/glutarate-semialdehyde dehydrogenase